MRQFGCRSGGGSDGRRCREAVGGPRTRAPHRPRHASEPRLGCRLQPACAALGGERCCITLTRGCRNGTELSVGDAQRLSVAPTGCVADSTATVIDCARSKTNTGAVPVYSPLDLIPKGHVMQRSIFLTPQLSRRRFIARTGGIGLMGTFGASALKAAAATFAELPFFNGRRELVTNFPQKGAMLLQ